MALSQNQPAPDTQTSSQQKAPSALAETNNQPTEMSQPPAPSLPPAEVDLSEQDCEKASYGSSDTEVRTWIERFYAPNSNFVLPGATSPRVVTGPLEPEEVDELLSRYQDRPVDLILSARLENSPCVVLLGPIGSGRRTGAIRALARRVKPSGLEEIGINDTATLDQYHFKSRAGYLLDTTFAAQPTEKFDNATLRSIRERLRTAQSFLVILGSDETAWNRLDPQFKVIWQAPTLEDLLAARRFEPPMKAMDKVSRILGGSPTVAKVNDLFDRVEEGRKRGLSDSEILSEMPQHRRQEIRSWFSQDRPLTEWVALSVLVLLSGSPRTEFDKYNKQLLDRVEEVIPASTDDGAYVRADLERPLAQELKNCQAEIAEVTLARGDVVSNHQIVRFSDEMAALVYLEEYWRAAPRRLQNVVLDWLPTIADQLKPDTANRIAERLALLAQNNSNLVTLVINEWASVLNPRANGLAAETAQAMTRSPMTRPLAYHLADQWARTDKPVGNQYSALYAYLGAVGLYQVRQACRVYVGQYAKRPVWSRNTFSKFSQTCISLPSQAEELTKVMFGFRAVQRGQTDSAPFHLIAMWFSEDASRPPIALELAKSPVARNYLAAIMACTLQRSYRHHEWLETLVLWADADDDSAAQASALLLLSAIRAVGTYQPAGSDGDLPRLRLVAEQLMDDLERFIERACHLDDGPSALAVERSLKALRQAKTDLAGDLYQ